MIAKRNYRFAKIGFIVAFAPLLRAYETGPDPGYTNAPGDNKTSCVASGCHQGTVNSGPGNVKILLPSGNSGTYTPGQSMQLLIQITDSTKSAYGFEMTARRGTGNTTQAGDFNTADNLTQVLCASTFTSLLKANGKSCAGASDLEYVEHNTNGFNASLRSTPSYTYTVNWTPPATDGGPVTFYVGANAGPGSPAVATPTNVYTTSLTLTAAASAPPSPPAIKAGGIVPIYSTRNTIEANSWVSIYGTNLATATTVWNGVFPIPSSLGDTTVTINNKPALLWVVVHDPVNGDQINLQAPDDTATGSVPVTVTTPNGTTSSTITLGQFSPSFSLLDAKYPAAIVITSGPGNSGGGYDIIGPAGHFAYTTRPVKPGETLVLFGVGFGPTNPPVPAGTSPPATGATAVNTPTVTIGGVKATVIAATLPLTGLFQIIVTVPANLGSGDQLLVATSGGLQTLANVFITVQ